MNRYLTPIEKVQHLQFWNDARARVELRLDRDNLGGLGFPDPEVYELTDRLNALSDELCTTQSCAGHRHQDLGVDEVSLWTGQLWVRASERVTRRFYERAFMLAENADMETVRLIFHADMGDVIDVQFNGMNRGKETLDRSAETIVGFFNMLICRRGY